MSNYLKIEELLDYHLYVIQARNGRYGIWLPEHRGFMLSRIKFGENFLFVEYHWDEPAFATVKPIGLIEVSPFGPADFESIIFTRADGSEYMAHRNGIKILEYLNYYEGTAEQRAEQGRR